MAAPDQPTVLVVEDDEQLLELYRHYLEPDYDVRTAASGADGLDLVDDAVDLVLLDRRMPGMSGDEVLTALRDRGFDGPVTMVTAVEPDTDIVDLPFDGYVVKPVVREDLQAVIESMLGRAAYDEAVRDYFAVGSKVAALEADHARAELEGDAKYRQLTDRLAAAREEASSALAALSSEEIDRLFYDIGSPTFRSPRDEDGPPES